jgi:hypothetical protein
VPARLTAMFHVACAIAAAAMSATTSIPWSPCCRAAGG